MTRYEHRTIRTTTDQMNAVLNDASRDGWEVVSILADATGIALIVKRPVPLGIPGAVTKDMKAARL